MVRRFQPVNVEEPNIEDAIEILNGIKPQYEEHHNVKYTNEAINAAVVLSKRYITERYLPDKAIDLIDEAGSRARLINMTRPLELKDIEEEIKKLDEEKQKFAESQNFEEAARLRDEVRSLQDKLSEKQEKWRSERDKIQTLIEEDDIRNVISEITNIPVKRLLNSESKRLIGMEEELHKKVVGQEEAISSISKAIRRSRAGLKSSKRPLGSFIFLGPTGVGKTALAKQLGCSQQYVSKLLKGGENLSLETISKIEKALSITIIHPLCGGQTDSTIMGAAEPTEEYNPTCDSE